MIIMDMESGCMEAGQYCADEFGMFEDEVLNAEWLPQQSAQLQSYPQPELQLALQEVMSTPAAKSARILDAESFLRNVYLSQR